VNREAFTVHGKKRSEENGERSSFIVRNQIDNQRVTVYCEL
jgi:hypothetical protein